ncbi:MAG: hypothetical protein ABRQ24_05960 [Syntrophomonadaceae bacterium]
MGNSLRTRWRLSCLALVLVMVISQLGLPGHTDAATAGATTSLHLVKYAADGSTVLAEKTVDYKWMEKNLTVYGDGRTHYYHQGPIFEGDLWDPGELNNLKDKGAVKGTAVKDLCDLIGGMAADDEVMLISVDKWHTEFAYPNIYTPSDAQGVIALCWYNGEDAAEGERYGVGYPANNGYRTAMQIVFMTAQTNREGQHVFGNTDMKTVLPQEKYQHFFEGQYPSTNGLSGKWITEVRIYSGGVPQGVIIELPDQSHPVPSKAKTPWLPIAMAIGGLGLLGVYYYMRRNAR